MATAKTDINNRSTFTFIPIFFFLCRNYFLGSTNLIQLGEELFLSNAYFGLLKCPVPNTFGFAEDELSIIIISTANDCRVKKRDYRFTNEVTVGKTKIS
jgi:hypothetical protein